MNQQEHHTQPIVIVRKKTPQVDNKLGLLINKLLSGDLPSEPLESLCAEYVDAKNGLASTDQVLQKACDGLVKHFSEKTEMREAVINYILQHGRIRSWVLKKGKELPAYLGFVANFESSLETVSLNHITAMCRGERQKLLGIEISCHDNEILDHLTGMLPKTAGPALFFLTAALTQCYHQHLKDGAIRSIRSEMSEKLQEGQLKLFAASLHNQLSQPSLGTKKVLAVAAHETQAVAVIVDEIGNASGDTVALSLAVPEEFATGITAIITKNEPHVVVLKSGKDSKALYPVLRATIAKLGKELPMMAIAIDELWFRHKKISSPTNNGAWLKEIALGLGKKIQNPLAWLKHFPPLELAVGPFQHDVNQDKLAQRLTATITHAEEFLSKNTNPLPLRLITLDKSIVGFVDFKTGLELKGRVTLVTPFGVFVDIGHYQDALAHRNDLPKEISHRYLDIFKPGMLVRTKIIGQDPKQEKIAITILPMEHAEAHGSYTEHPHGEHLQKRDQPRSPRHHNDRHRPKQDGKPTNKKSFKFGTLGDQLKNLLEK